MSSATPDGAAPSEDGQIVLRGSQGLRAIAHPARALAVERLMDGAQLTATELGKEAGVSPSAMSYHLRQLARWGLVRRVDSSPDGRERRWRAEGTSLAVLPDGAASFSAGMLHTVVGRYVERLLAALTRVSERDAGPSEHGTINYSVLWLTEDERQRLVEALGNAVDAVVSTERTSQRHPPGARRYEMWTFLLADRDASNATAEPTT